MTTYRKLCAALLLGVGLIIAGRADAQVVPLNGGTLFVGLTNSVQQVKGTTGNVVRITCANTDATHISFVQFFNVAAGTSVSLGTTPPNLSVGFGPSTEESVELGVYFPLGIKIAATRLVNDSNAPVTVIDCNIVFQ